MGNTLKRLACLVGKELVLLTVEGGPRLPLSEAGSCFKAQGIRNYPLLLLQGGG